MSFNIKFDTKKLENQLNKQLKKIIENEEYKINLKNKSEGTNMVILKPMEEETLKILLDHYDGNDDNCVEGYYEWFPKYIQISIKDVAFNLRVAGVIAKENMYMENFIIYLTPNGITYFQDKEEYLKKCEEEKMEKGNNVINVNGNSGNIVLGNVTNSTLSIDNSVTEIEKEIDEKGGEDKEELMELLDEAKELIENIKASRQVPNNKGFIKRLTANLDKHGWFYAQIVALLGKALLDLL